ncbi:type IV pilus biogenesis/stability protein PilW [Ursidibacter arcticus]|uniref:type IV pilus biogenesis/stability protein PilW n=1 Tax=Ursidibacter arcticus TaxID=1524965 RepID=UPI0012FCA935|nr:type IV pilus biogenesis/stability protein PilW [Ursidibacter arcticus]KAE9536211.1 type IV pilus biogenesis/stability protein PilW [Ursidibacter arcticus]
MAFAKFFKNLTACMAVLWLVGCTSKPLEQVEFNRSEAVTARIKLALAYLEQNDFPKAKQNIDKALEHDNQDYLPYSVLAYYYQQIGENTKAQETFKTAISLSEKLSETKQPRPDVLNNYGAFLCKQSEFNNAYQQFEQALQSQELYYNQADTLENIALCAHQQQNQTKQNDAVAQLEKLEPKRANNLKLLLK